MGVLSQLSCQSPVAHSCGLLNHLNSFCRGMFKLKAKFSVDLFLYSLSHFEATATQYTCSLSGVYHPHWLVQWSHHCSHMCIPVHSPWLPGYINVMQTVLIILTMAGLFDFFWTDYIYIYIYIYLYIHIYIDTYTHSQNTHCVIYVYNNVYMYIDTYMYIWHNEWFMYIYT